jgi:chemotaxis protein CheD
MVSSILEEIMDKIVGIGEYAISNNPEDILKTFALASCVGLTVYCPEHGVAGLVHIALPHPSEESSSDSFQRPYYYAITAVPFLINQVCNRCGCPKNKLELSLFGGADSSNEKDVFHIGRKNIQQTKQILDEMNLKYNDEHTGGTLSRTLEMEVATGRIKVTTQPLRI